MRLIEAAEERSKRFRELKAIEAECPGSQRYWEAYCDFVDAEAELDAAMARADRANGTWELKVAK